MISNVFWGYRDLALFVGAGLPSLAAAVGLLAGVQAVAGGALPKAAAAMVIQFGLYGFWFLALAAILRVRYRRPFWESLSWRPDGGQILRCLALGPALMLVVALLSNLIGQVPIKSALEALLTNWGAVILVGVFATTLGPLCEELAFRGFIQPLLGRTFGDAAGIALVAAPFALVHGPQYSWSWRHVLLIGLAGVAFGWARWKTGSTAASTALHATYNLSFLIAFVFTQRDMLTW